MKTTDLSFVDAATKAAMRALTNETKAYVSERNMQAALSAALYSIATAPGCPIPQSLTTIAALFAPPVLTERAPGWFSAPEVFVLRLPGLPRKNPTAIRGYLSTLAIDAPDLVMNSTVYHPRNGMRPCRLFHAGLLPTEAQQVLLASGQWDGRVPAAAASERAP